MIELKIRSRTGSNGYWLTEDGRPSGFGTKLDSIEELLGAVRWSLQLYEHVRDLLLDHARDGSPHDNCSR